MLHTVQQEKHVSQSRCWNSKQNTRSFCWLADRLQSNMPSYLFPAESLCRRLHLRGPLCPSCSTLYKRWQEVVYRPRLQHSLWGPQKAGPAGCTVKFHRKTRQLRASLIHIKYFYQSISILVLTLTWFSIILCFVKHWIKCFHEKTVLNVSYCALVPSSFLQALLMFLSQW